MLSRYIRHDTLLSKEVAILQDYRKISLMHSFLLQPVLNQYIQYLFAQLSAEIAVSWPCTELYGDDVVKYVWEKKTVV